MSGIVFIFVLICAATGGWLIFDFLLWHFTGAVTRGTIERFVSKKDGYGRLPVFSFKKEDGQTVSAQAKRVTQLMYIFGQPEEGVTFSIIYRDGDPPEVRVHGYLYVILAGFLFIPLLFYVALTYGNTPMLGSLSFALTFVVIVLGGWMLLKLIQKS